MAEPDTPPADEPAPPDPPAPQAQDPVPEPDPLGDAGKAALDAERRARRQAEKDAKDLKARLEEIEHANASDAEKALATARREGEEAARSTYVQRLVAAEIKIAAAGKVATEAVDDLPALLAGELAEFVDKDGNVDSTAIGAAIARLVQAKPYLRRVASADPDQGPKGGPSGGQLTREQLEKLPPEEQYKAFLEGRAESALAGR